MKIKKKLANQILAKKALGLGLGSTNQKMWGNLFRSIQIFFKVFFFKIETVW